MIAATGTGRVRRGARPTRRRLSSRPIAPARRARRREVGAGFAAIAGMAVIAASFIGLVWP
jgi:hypothetical protein